MRFLLVITSNHLATTVCTKLKGHSRSMIFMSFESQYETFYYNLDSISHHLATTFKVIQG